jgi:hypothetical protein
MERRYPTEAKRQWYRLEMYSGRSLVSELAREARKKRARRSRKFRVGEFSIVRVVCRRAVIVDLRSVCLKLKVLKSRGVLLPSASLSFGDLFRWYSADCGRNRATGKARTIRMIPIQRGSHNNRAIVADASAGPSWREKMAVTALT